MTRNLGTYSSGGVASAALRFSHSILALLLFVTFTAHMSAVLFHTFVLRDGILDRMALWPTKRTRPQRVP